MGICATAQQTVPATLAPPAGTHPVAGQFSIILRERCSCTALGLGLKPLFPQAAPQNPSGFLVYLATEALALYWLRALPVTLDP